MKVLIPGYKYQLEMEQGGFQILQFAHEEFKDGGAIATVHNGTTNEEVLKVLINRIIFQDQKFEDENTRKALEYLISANARLNMRKEALGV